MNEDEFNALYPHDPLGVVEAQLNEYVEHGVLERWWDRDRGTWMYRAKHGEALDRLMAEDDDDDA